MECEWDEGKSRANLKKHGLAFQLAVEAFEDPNAFTSEDYIDDYGEMRYQTIAIVDGLIILIAFVYRIAADGSAVPRIISLRKATRNEQQIYLTHSR